MEGDAVDIPITDSHFKESLSTAAEARRRLVLASRMLANEGLCDAYGHVSVRNPENPDTFFLPRATSPELVMPDDIMELNLDNQIVSGKEEWKIGECVIHSSIYRVRTDVNCVCHTHPAELVAFASTDVPLRSLYHQDITSCDGIPVFRDIPEECGMLINDVRVADQLAQVLGDKRGVLIRNHGAVTVGESVARAIYSTITMRDNARIYLMAATLSSQLDFIGREEVAYDLRNQFYSRCLQRAWNYWCDRAIGAFPEIASLDDR
jgi:ribulose-5-phosphate 4-epimerase/fuculose-1-phosphate aldolase